MEHWDTDLDFERSTGVGNQGVCVDIWEGDPFKYPNGRQIFKVNKEIQNWQEEGQGKNDNVIISNNFRVRKKMGWS